MERLGVHPLRLIVRHSINRERSIPATNVPLDGTLMVLANDFLLPALTLVLALGPAPDAPLEVTGESKLPRDI